MTVTAEHTDALRSVLSGDDAPLTGLAAASPENGGYLSVLTVLALAAAARARFADGWSGVGLIRYVARTRAKYGFTDLAPTLAEELLAFCLGGGPMSAGNDQVQQAYAQFALLKALADDLSALELNAVFREAREQANQWIEQQNGNPVPPLQAP